MAGRLGVAVLAALAGCTVGPDFQQPKPWWQPSSWLGGPPKPAAGLAEASVPVPAAPDPAWWTIFHDPQLTELERRTGQGNFNLRIATIRIAESRAQTGIARADAFPTFNGNASYAREQQSKKGVIALFGGGGSGGGGGTTQTASNGAGGTSGAFPNSGLTAPFDLYQYGFDASWELDLWGRVRRNIESATAQALAGEEARRDSLVSAQAEVARDYIDLRGTQEQLRIAQENLGTFERTLALTQERARGGLSTDLDVADAAAQLEATRSQIPTLQAQVVSDGNAIALLLGEPPEALADQLGTPHPVPPVPPTVPVGLPSDLVRRRPDIRRAEAQLHSATADIGVATADFFPKVSLSGSAAVQSVQFKDLGSWALADTYGLGPTITLPIFQGGRLTRTLELRQSQQQEAAVSYQQAVLGALHDVDNALTSYSAEQGRRAALGRSVEQNRMAVGLANQQYQAGIATFLNVLDAQRQLLSAQQQLATSQTTVSTNLVALYKALGGGWEQDYPENQPAPPEPSAVKALIEQ